MIPNDKAMPNDNSLPHWEQLGIQPIERTIESSNHLLAQQLRNESASRSLMVSLQQRQQQAAQTGVPASQLSYRGAYSNSCDVRHTTMPATMISQNLPANQQGIDKAVLRDICRLLGHPVVPKPHEPAGLRHPTSFVSAQDVYQPPQGPPLLEPQGGTESHFQRANTHTDMDASFLFAKVTKQIHDGQDGLYSQLLQHQPPTLFPSDVQHRERGTNMMPSNQTHWPSSIGTHGNNGNTRQQLLYSLSSQEVPRWSGHPNMGHTDIFGNITTQGFQQLPSETISPIVRPKQILRALSAYNFFFRDERDRIVSETEGQYETSSEKKQQLLGGHWYRDRTKKRRHRKTHGKIAFTELSKVISQRWKDLSDELKAFYREVAAEDLMRYHRELEDQKNLQDSLS